MPRGFCGDSTPTQTIIALSGRKGSGKNTLGKFIGAWFAENVAKDQVCKCVHECSFADDLKRFCIETLGLPHSSCYGSDDEKNAPTQYQWEKTPKFLRWKFGTDPVASLLVSKGAPPDQLMDMFHDRRLKDGVLKSGPMSGRDIMQVFGTDLIRQTFGNIWAAATIRSIKRRGAPLSIITDNRFPNEIKSVIEEPRGFVIRLTRSPFGYDDVHPSESALDDYNWSQDKHFVLDNVSLNIDQANDAVVGILRQIFRETME